MAVTPGPHVPGTQEALHDCQACGWSAQSFVDQCWGSPSIWMLGSGSIIERRLLALPPPRSPCTNQSSPLPPCSSHGGTRSTWEGAASSYFLCTGRLSAPPWSTCVIGVCVLCSPRVRRGRGTPEKGGAGSPQVKQEGSSRAA